MQFQPRFNWSGHFDAKCAWNFFQKTQDLYWLFRLPRKYVYRSPKILFCLEYRGQSYGKLANHLIHDIHLWLLLWYHGEKHVKMSHKLCSRQLYWCLWNHLWLCCVPLFVQLEHMLQNVIQITSMQGMKYYFCTNIRSMLLYFIKCSSANCTW